MENNNNNKNNKQYKGHYLFDFVIVVYGGYLEKICNSNERIF